ncbi:uncharacterized protein LOC110847659 isoform X2 [Folsomia candida]|uniref:uncharacterized protein LOC110847659 isoform X2 n=1 Tax=Folsomia candida TaxID=158441 RepID=UPI0016052784|nr:uncharacterized protein LOC110847659 isoform X2 [Folsomia candida]
MLYKIWLILTCENSFQDGIIQKRLGITDQSLVKHKGIIGGPFTWSNKRKRIVQISNPRKFIYHYKCLLFYVAVLSIKAIFHHHFSQLVPLKLVIMHLYTAITHTIILTVPYLDPRKCVQCFNSFLYFCLKFKAKNLPRLNMNTDQMSRNMTKFILAFTLAFGNVPSFVIIHYLHEPADSPFFTSMIPQNYRNRLITFFIGLIHFYGYWKDLRFGLINYRSSWRLRTVGNLPIAYRSVEILHHAMMKTFGPLILPIQAILGNGTLLVSYTVIRHWNNLQPAQSFMLVLIVLIVLTFWVVALQTGCYFYKESSKTLTSWSCNGRSKMHFNYIKKFKKSCKPLICNWV